MSRERGRKGGRVTDLVVMLHVKVSTEGHVAWDYRLGGKGVGRGA